MSKNRIVESKLARTAKLLAAQHNIKVRFEAGVAETKDNTITLPTLPDNADQELQDAMQGYLDQQAGYVLFGDTKHVARMRKDAKTSKEASQLYDVYRTIEDDRVEQQMEDLFPGCQLNFQNAHAWFYQRLRDGWEDLTDFRKILTASFLERRYPGSSFTQDVVGDDILKKAQEVNDLLRKLNPNTSQDSAKAAEKVLELLDQEVEEDREQMADPQDGGEGGQGGEGEGAPQDAAGHGDQMAQALAQKAQQELEAKCSKAPPGSPRAPGNEGYEHNLADDGVGYAIWSRDEDTILDIEEGSLQRDGAYLQQLREESRRTTNVMRKRLVNSLRAQQRRRWVSGRPEGRLDARKAYKAIHGINPNVYKIRTNKNELDTAIALAIDHSGSMHGQRLKLAAEAAIVLGDVFDPLRIPFLVYGFSTKFRNTYPTGKDADLYARWNALWIRHYKRFDESWRQGSLKLTYARNNCMNNTLDGESVLYGVQRLLARPEKRKILLVFNDGGPYPGDGNVARCQHYLKQVVAGSQNAGVEIICFGIMTDEVKHYYDQWVLIDEVDDLVNEPLKRIDGMLRKGMRAQRKK